MPLGTCKDCNQKYHYDSQNVYHGSSYGPDRCFMCTQGHTPESYAWGEERRTSFDTSSYTVGHFAHAAVRSASHHPPVYHRVRIRQIFDNGTVTTFCDKLFLGGKFRDPHGYTWELVPFSNSFEIAIARRELEGRIDGLWRARRNELKLEDLVSIMDIIGARLT